MNAKWVQMGVGASLAGLALIMTSEGIPTKVVNNTPVAVAYKDPVGIVTICYGHTGDVFLGQKLTMDECETILAKDAKKASDFIWKTVKVPLTQEELDAYVSFTYNVGTGALKNSTLMTKLNKGDRVGACNELLRWVYAKGVLLKGLVVRRAKENALCLKGATK